MDETRAFESALRARAQERCELCAKADSDALAPQAVGPKATHLEHYVLLCETCQSQVKGAALDPRHWFCLRESIWSEVPAVQVLAYRMLRRMELEPWATDLLGQVYLEEAVLAWALAGQQAEEGPPTLDSNGLPLENGDSVTLIKDLPVKGAGFTAKRGTMVKNIRLIDDPENIEGRINKMTLVLKTKFLKKV